MKIAVNKCFGGFDLSEKAYERMIELGVKTYNNWEELKENHKEGVYVVITDDSFGKYYSNFGDYKNRNNNVLIQVIEELKDEASGSFGDIKIIDIPESIEWEIDDYDGVETIRESHMSW